jgi:hypothetical protein
MKGKKLTATLALQSVAIAQANIYLQRYGLAPPNKLSLIFFWEFMLNSPIQDWCASCKDHNYSQNRNKIGMTFVGLVLHLLGYMNSKSCQLMHIYSIEVEDSQTCHDFWEKTNALWST